MSFSNKKLVCKLCGKCCGDSGGTLKDSEYPYNETLGCPNPECKENQDFIPQEEYDRN